MTSPTGAIAAAPVKLLALGDSLTAGYGLPEPQGFTSQLQKALTAKGYAVTVVNAGVSGDTTAGGRARLDWALADKPDAAIVELGANDMLRGLDPGQARANLDAILKSLQERKVPTLLAGMLASPSLGKPYTDAFNAIYPDLAGRYGVPLYPFFLDGVALDRALIQPDGLHPNAQGVAVIVERILPAVTKLLDSLPQTAKTGG
ncbi:arylesterase [Azospirillum sp. TSO35-2]|uniref:arylesterase n=1 Tax=Azospirillum sp. TSO35-2 TaxID=716796 RepID=UPI000D61AF4A|nr:arylesterase [Azospirillum sp. TSO35-2]PWC34399.1 acyl-CoA thioesterase [Azospirillum sp. TSO35-2]